MIPAELFQLNVSSEPRWTWRANSRYPTRRARQAYAGWDVARRHDLSVIWLAELVGDVTWTRGVIEMRNVPTPDQVRQARAIMPLVRRGWKSIRAEWVWQSTRRSPASFLAR